MASLRVEQAEDLDVGKCRVRIDPDIMDQMDIQSGSIIEIMGKNSTGVIALRGSTIDKGKGLARMDGVIRSNIGVALGDVVKLKKAHARPALEILIAPIRGILKADALEPVAAAIKKTLEGRPVKTYDVISHVKGISLGEKKFKVCKTRPSGIVQIKDTTDITVIPKLPEKLEAEGTRIPDVTYEDIGGLDDRILRIREIIELPLRYPELFDRLGIQAPAGVLLQGPPGCGKTLLAKAVANESDSYFISINGPEIMSKFYGESEKRIRQIFDEAEKNAPSIIFIDEIDSIAPKRENVTGEVERRVVAQLLALMDGLKFRNNVIVIAASNRPNAIDLALRRPGRFDREIEIGVPDRKGRLEILEIHTRGMPLENVNLEEYARRTHGFVGADLASLCREAAMFALRRIRSKINFQEAKVSPEVLMDLKVIKKDFEEAMKIVEPSALREIMVEVPNVTWDQVGGLDQVIQDLIEAVDLPIRKPEIFEKFNIKPTNGVLLFGCPGTGKTLLAKAVATHSEVNFIPVRGPEIFSKWVGESERAIREIFRKARQTSPSIVFFDEIDAIAPERGSSGSSSKVIDTVVNQLLSELSGIQDLKQIVVVAATNRPELLDPALIRPGRLDKLIYIPMPNTEARLKIIEIHTKGMPLTEDVDLKQLASLTENYSGADIENVCREAVMIGLRQNPNFEKVSMSNFIEAIRTIRPSVSLKTIEKFDNMALEMTGRRCE
ncbi:MAG: CDC48 family AAA ATPase [Candidatus Helarchaeota archaeon]